MFAVPNQWKLDLIIEPQFKLSIFLRSKRWEKALDGNVRRRDEHGLGMGQHIKAMLPIVGAS
jgi:hypothetical protein